MPWARTILDLCAGTGSWSQPYVDAGYDVIRVELADGQDVRLLTRGELPERVHGILAAPPCTMFSFARQRAKKPRDFAEGMAVVDACLRIITLCRPDWWALENPVGYLRRFMGDPRVTFRPCDYGDPYTKRTDLWGTFSEPCKSPVAVEKEAGKGFGDTRGWSFARTGRDGMTRTQVRSITPAGFARAFMEANP